MCGTKCSASILKMASAGENPWKYTGPPQRAHFNAHFELYRALRAGRRINHRGYMTRSTLIGITGQVSCYTGLEAAWEQISKSGFYFPPKPEDVRLDMEPPVKPDAEGICPPAYTPGKSRLLLGFPGSGAHAGSALRHSTAQSPRLGE